MAGRWFYAAGRRLVKVMEWAKFGQNGVCMASLWVGVCILSRHNKKPLRGAKLGMEGIGLKYEHMFTFCERWGQRDRGYKTNICLHFVKGAQIYKIVSKTVDFFN